MVKFATRDVGFTRVANMPQISYLPSFDHICTQVKLCVCTKITGVLKTKTPKTPKHPKT